MFEHQGLIAFDRALRVGSLERAQLQLCRNYEEKTTARLKWLRKNSKMGGWGFEGAWLQPRLTALFKDLRHGWEAVPLQNSNAREFFRKLLKPRPFKTTVAHFGVFPHAR